MKILVTGFEPFNQSKVNPSMEILSRLKAPKRTTLIKEVLPVEFNRSSERIRELLPYQVNAKAMANADKDAIFMHCLPAFHDVKTKIGARIAEKFGIREMEVTNDVFESPQSKVFEEAENRMHTIKAVMAATLTKSRNQ